MPIEATHRPRIFAGVRHPLRFLWKGLLQPLLGWLLLGWMTLLVPRKRGRVAVIGLSGQFADNSKYLFLRLVEAPPHGLDVRYLADHPRIASALEEAGLPSISYPSLRGLWYLLRCETVVVDASSWVRPMRYQVLWRARKVQLWHGCPLKRIELDDRRSERAPGLLLGLSQRLIGRYPRYDFVLSPSPRFTDIAFRRAFGECEVIEAAYPRNIVFGRQDPNFLIGTDRSAVGWIDAGKRQGLTTVFYLPTFRDTGGDAMSDGALDVARLQEFALERGYQFLIKRHPVAVALREPRGESRIHICEPRADVYPLLARCDVLITDYSSVFFDFLHAGRPIVFFAYDLERYLRQDRSMYFGYERIAPGPICRSQADLEDALLACRNNADGDPFARRRAELLEWAFAPVDGQRLDRIASYL
jgi:CDP-glycerol glycerophosphotransferase